MKLQIFKNWDLSFTEDFLPCNFIWKGIIFFYISLRSEQFIDFVIYIRICYI